MTFRPRLNADRLKALAATVREDRSLCDTDHVSTLGSSEWHLVGDLRRNFHQEGDPMTCSCSVCSEKRTDKLRLNVRHQAIAHSLAERHEAPDLYAPPDPYARDIATLRAAATTPESTFEDQWKASRMRELEAEHAALDAAAPTLRLTAVDLSSWSPPDPYAAGIKALQALEARAREAKDRR